MSGEGREAAERTAYSFLLFVAGEETNSVLAKNNLTRICKKHLDGRYSIGVVDVLEDFSTAIENGIIVTPTLVILQPEPRVTIFGNLNDAGKVLAALRLKGEAH
jgi:circadian clock protein KaiB